MTAKPSHTDVSEAVKPRNSSRNSSENTDASADDSADFHDACVVGAHNPRPGVELSCLAATADEGNAQRCKKSSFQITRVVQAEAGDDADDVTSAEDLVSSLDGKKNTNTELDAQSVDTTHSPSSVEDVELSSSSSCQKHLLPNHSKLVARTRPSDINSRFKIVKIESNKPQRRGRWVCLEFLDPPQISEPPEKTVKHDNVESSGSSTANPIYYLQMGKEDPSNDKFAAAIVYSDGHLSLEPNPLPFAESAARPSPCSIASSDTSVLPLAIHQLSDHCAATSSKEMSSLSLESNNREPEPTTRSSDRRPPCLSAVRQHSRRDEGDCLRLANGVSSDEMINNARNDAVQRTGSEPLFVHSMVSESVSSPLFAIVPSSADAYVYGLAENDASGEGICGLDNKIEQAMDLVKSHLMFAVHEEVELLKDQIKELTIKKGQLEYENRVLRASATQETLEKLHDVIVSQPILTIINN